MRAQETLIATRNLGHCLSGQNCSKRLDTEWNRTEMMRKNPKQTSWIMRPIFMVFMPFKAVLLSSEVASVPPMTWVTNAAMSQVTKSGAVVCFRAASISEVWRITHSCSGEGSKDASPFEIQWVQHEEQCDPDQPSHQHSNGNHLKYRGNIPWPCSKQLLELRGQ